MISRCIQVSICPADQLNIGYTTPT